MAQCSKVTTRNYQLALLYKSYKTKKPPSFKWKKNFRNKKVEKSSLNLTKMIKDSENPWSQYSTIMIKGNARWYCYGSPDESGISCTT